MMQQKVIGKLCYHIRLQVIHMFHSQFISPHAVIAAFREVAAAAATGTMQSHDCMRLLGALLLP